MRIAARRQHVARAEEPGDGGVHRLPQHLERPALLMHAPADQHVALVGERERLVAVVRDVQHRQAALAAHPPKQVLQRLTRLGVDGAQRLVEQEGAGTGGERPRQRHPLALAARESRRAAGEQVPHADRLGQQVHVGRGAPRPIRDVLLHREVREEQAVLEHEAHMAPLRRQGGYVLAGQQDLSGDRRAHAGDSLQHQALAGAAGAEEHGVGAVLYRQTDRSHAEAACLHLESAQLDHGAPVFDRRRRGIRNDRTRRNTTNATMTMSTAGGCAARSPKPSNRSNVSTEMTLGL